MIKLSFHIIKRKKSTASTIENHILIVIEHYTLGLWKIDNIFYMQAQMETSCKEQEQCSCSASEWSSRQQCLLQHLNFLSKTFYLNEKILIQLTCQHRFRTDEAQCIMMCPDNHNSFCFLARKESQQQFTNNKDLPVESILNNSAVTHVLSWSA